MLKAFHIPARIAVLFAGLALTTGAALAADTATPDWPCVQGKVESLSVGQIWDGPAVEPDKLPWNENEAIMALLPVLTSRRVPVAEAEAAIKKFAEAQPAADRDAKLTLLFAALFETTNGQRRTVVGGLEKYLKAQRDRAKVIEQKGLDLEALQQKSGLDEAGEMAVAKAQEAYDWESRIFQERQQSIPIACEVPVLIEERFFGLTKSIRALMSK